MTDEGRPFRDEDLSALVDGELDAQASAALREGSATDVALARRLAAFEGVGEALRSTPTHPPEDAALERIRLRIATQTGEARSDQAARGRGARLAPPRRRRALWAGAVGAAVLAASFALLVLAGGEGPVPIPDPQVARAPAPAPELVETELLASASDEELGIAFELETLSDFEVIEQLELLELMAALESPERG